MSPATATSIQEIKIDYSSLGAFFWNPYPPAKAGVFVERNGIKYPFGTQVVIVCGQHYALPPQELFCVQRHDPNYFLIIRNIENTLGTGSINDWGIRHVDMARLEKEGEQYLEELDTRGANIICETLHRTIVEAFEKDNQKRVSQDLAKREHTLAEKRGLAVLRSLSKRLGQQGRHEVEGELKAIEEGAESLPDIAVNLQNLPIKDLRRLAKKAGLITTRGIKKTELMAILRAKRKQQMKEDSLRILGTDPASAVKAALKDEPPEDEDEVDVDEELDEEVEVEEEELEIEDGDEDEKE